MVSCLLHYGIFALTFTASISAPVQLIIDTDLGFDVDDVGAIAVGHALANKGVKTLFNKERL